jgi:hypothetical protein
MLSNRLIFPGNYAWLAVKPGAWFVLRPGDFCLRPVLQLKKPSILPPEKQQRYANDG